MIRNLCCTLGVLMAAVAQAADVSSPLLVESYLTEGRLAEAANALTTHMKEDPTDAQAQYCMGVVRLLQAVEGLAQNLHHYGLKSTSPQLPFVRLPVPQNANPEKLTYEKWRGVLEQFNDDLDRAAGCTTDVRKSSPYLGCRNPPSRGYSSSPGVFHSRPTFTSSRSSELRDGNLVLRAKELSLAPTAGRTAPG